MILVIDTVNISAVSARNREQNRVVSLIPPDETQSQLRTEAVTSKSVPVSGYREQSALQEAACAMLNPNYISKQKPL